MTQSGRRLLLLSYLGIAVITVGLLLLLIWIFEPRGPWLFVLGISDVLITGLLAVWITARVITPLDQLTAATQDIAAGRLDQPIAVNALSRVGELAQLIEALRLELQTAEYNRQHLTSNIAHDLATPISVIYGSIDGMHEGYLKVTTKRLKEVLSELEDLRTLVNNLNLLSELDRQSLTLNLMGTDLSRFLDLYLSEYGPFPKNITLITEFTPDLPLVAADPGHLERVLNKLVDNALRYTPEAGTIRICTETRPEGGAILIEDSGSGIPIDQIEHIFERFYQIDPARSEGGALGLGLTIVKALVEAMGGEIAVGPARGHSGALFTITLPKYELVNG